jgi:hypothetical protein
MSTASVVLAIATLVPVTAGAQGHNHGAAQPASPPVGSVVTVTGCLARGTAPDSFVIQNVAWKSVNVPAGQEPGAKPSAQATSETLRLAGAASTLKLDAHVGHTINATGTLGKADPVVTPGIVLPDPQPQGDTTSRQAAEAEAKAKAGANSRLLLMKSMEHVAPQCK